MTRSANVRFGSKADVDRNSAIAQFRGLMLRSVFALILLCISCGPAEQPKSLKTVAAYEVPLQTPADKQRFLKLLREQAEASGFHVDAATDEELKALSEVSPQTFSAAVWRGKNDDESIASAMDFEDRLGRVWLSFSLGEDPQRSARFREKLVPEIRRLWPETASLPIMPNGGIPLTEDLVRTPSGYAVKESAAAKYRSKSQ